MVALVTTKATSQVNKQLPAFIGEEYPLFEKFLKNYYVFLETIKLSYDEVSEHSSEFTVGETITGLTSGATGIVRGNNGASSTLKVFVESTNDIMFAVDEQVYGTTSAAYGIVTSIARQPLNAIKNFLDIIDTDETTISFLEKFKSELYPNIRNTAEVDFRLFLRNVRDFYRSRGSEDSFRALFRVLYGGENLDNIYYPKQDMLRISDGNWSQETVLQLPYDPSNIIYNGTTITGQTSGATAFVSIVKTRRIGNVFITELVLTNIVGTFSVGEVIIATISDGETITAELTGMLSIVSGITINNSGNAYLVGDAAVIVDPANVGFGASAEVSKITNDQIGGITIENPGNGYQVGQLLVFDNTGTNAIVTAEAQVASLANPYIQAVVTTQIDVVTETKEFDLSGNFGVTISAGQLIANGPIFSLANAKGDVISSSESGGVTTLKIYDRASRDIGPTIDFTLNNVFSVSDPLQGDILTNNATYANATKKMTVETYDPTTRRVTATLVDGFDKFVVTDTLYSFTSLETAIDIVSQPAINQIFDYDDAATTAFSDGDTLYLFDSNENPIIGSISTTINDADASFITTNHVNIDDADYSPKLSRTEGTYATSGTTTTVTVADKHNLSTTDVVKLEFTSGDLSTEPINVYSINIVDDTTFTITTTNASTTGNVEILPYVDGIIKNAMVYEDQTFGRIESIDIISYGLGYESLPSVSVANTVYYDTINTVDEEYGGVYGRNAKVSIPGFAGKITEITITEPGFGYSFVPIVDLSGSGDGTAIATASLSPTRTKIGRFLDDNGHPSSTKRIQDNDLYQDFSYVLRTTDSINVWRNDVLKLLHPAGHKLFGEVLISTELDTQINSVDSSIITSTL